MNRPTFWVFGLLALLATNLATESSLSQPSQLLFQDDFDTNKNAWDVGGVAEADYRIENGKYVIDFRQDRNAIYLTIPIPLDEGRDFAIASTLTKCTGGDDCLYGITWGKGEGGFYVFEINGKGSLTVQKSVEGKFQELITKVDSPYVRKGKATNTLAIRQEGHALKFFVNDHPAGELLHQKLFGYRTGFVVGGKQRVEVDRIMISQPAAGEEAVSAESCLDQLAVDLLRGCERRPGGPVTDDSVRIAFAGFDGPGNDLYGALFLSSVMKYWKPPKYRLYIEAQMGKTNPEGLLISGNVSSQGGSTVVSSQLSRRIDGEVLASAWVRISAQEQAKLDAEERSNEENPSVPKTP